ncbi:hypothetical protein CAPTEDRAFT_192410 [Capitella teleta]|uniref:Uncharacterized protein n=1 Tax=Capitella teleta TaxID=283909 RepID=R7VKD7_CAPTE|nr:hypothetical protein CAPTEDRAFT_192410 [Capitella teleta]|eukprot:ELU16670.1 hypothetical protein CAPTEDRAFT_192410 [Capitella teleta]
MLAGESGKRLFKSLRVVSRGDSILEGSRYSNVKSVYSWKQIMPNNFSLCVVTVESDIETTLSVKSNQYQTFLYHRLDLEKDSDKCEYFGATATTAESAVLLSPIAFEKPYLQIIRKETVQDVKQYKSHFENGVSSSKFKEFVYDYVVLSAYLDELVLDQAHELLDSAVWAYVGFNVGVFRLYPGTRLNQEYDATKRPWYKRALAQKGRIAFSIPYEDAFGAGAVITMSKTILASRPQVPYDKETARPFADDISQWVSMIANAPNDSSFCQFYALDLTQVPPCRPEEVNIFSLVSRISALEKNDRDRRSMENIKPQRLQPSHPISEYQPHTDQQTNVRTPVPVTVSSAPPEETWAKVVDRNEKRIQKVTARKEVRAAAKDLHVVVGTAGAKDVKACPPLKHIFVYKVSRDCTADSIRTLMKSNGVDPINIRITSKPSWLSSSFCISIAKDELRIIILFPIRSDCVLN